MNTLWIILNLLSPATSGASTDGIQCVVTAREQKPSAKTFVGAVERGGEADPKNLSYGALLDLPALQAAIGRKYGFGVAVAKRKPGVSAVTLTTYLSAAFLPSNWVALLESPWGTDDYVDSKLTYNDLDASLPAQAPLRLTAIGDGFDIRTSCRMCELPRRDVPGSCLSEDEIKADATAEGHTFTGLVVAE